MRIGMSCFQIALLAELTYRVRVNKVVSEVEEAVISVREAEESWRGEMREIRGEVESVRELVPRVRLHPFILLQCQR
jgi:hypothetical protein